MMGAEHEKQASSLLPSGKRSIMLSFGAEKRTEIKHKGTVP